MTWKSERRSRGKSMAGRVAEEGRVVDGGTNETGGERSYEHNIILPIICHARDTAQCGQFALAEAS
jgi:hypothetical protein